MKYLISSAVVLDIDEDELVDVVQRMEANVREQMMAALAKALVENGETLAALSEITDADREEIDQKVQFFGVFVAPIKDVMGLMGV